jgi:bifunctional ADP-heptose synthase (sugar kinase/adenylyltransferase)
MRMANRAAGIVVGKLGTAVVHPGELRGTPDRNGSLLDMYMS